MSKRVYEDDRFGEPLDSWIQNALRYHLDQRLCANRIEDRIGRTEEAFGKLIELLMNKGLLSQTEILTMVGMSMCNPRREKIEIREGEE